MLLQQESNSDSDNPPATTQRNENLPNNNRCEQHLQFNHSWENTLCHVMKHQKKMYATFHWVVFDAITNREI